MNRFDPYGGRVPGSSADFEIERLRAEIRTLREALETYETAPKTLVTVLHVDEDKRLLRVVVNGHVVEVGYNPNAPYASKLKLGAAVRIVQGPQGAVFHDVAAPFEAGPIVSVVQELDEKICEVVDGVSGTRVVYVAIGRPVKVGERVLLDPSSMVVVRSFGLKDKTKVLGEEMRVTFDDVGGQAEAKRALHEALLEPHERKEVYARFGMKPSKGVLLWGPPGTGKTMLAKASASALAKHFGKEAVTSGFIYVKGPEVLNKFLGETEAAIRKMFSQAREHEEKYGYPAVIMLDEADALLGRRGSMGPGWEGIDRTIVPQFLAEMDGMRGSGAFVLLATNRPDILDPAVVRDGRIDRKVHVRRPNLDDAIDVFEKSLRGRPAVKGLAAHAAVELFSPERKLFKLELGDGQEFVTLAELVTGAMIAGVVQRAAQWAIRDDAKKIDEAHVDFAIRDVEAEQRRLAHDLNDFMDLFVGRAVVSFAPVALPEKKP